MRISELDVMEVGRQLGRLPLVSRKLGHTKPQYSIVYLRGSDQPEVQFLVDVLGGEMTTDEIIDKWYGGEEGVKELGPM